MTQIGIIKEYLQVPLNFVKVITAPYEVRWEVIFSVCLSVHGGLGTPVSGLRSLGDRGRGLSQVPPGGGGLP